MSMALIKKFRSSFFNSRSQEKPQEAEGFGTFFGVYVPSVLMMFGVIIFLRLGWILGSVGLYSTLLIVSLASLITLITTLSLSASATNSHVGKGGVYYMISRSLGIETGSAIGIPLFLRQCISIAFCVVGFAESFFSLFPSIPIVYVGIVTLILLTVLAYTSANLALKIQLVIFGIMIASLISLFTGGEVRSHATSAVSSLAPVSFWAAFAIFFPAMTGIESSVSLSGDLRNPSRSLPIGTLSAVLTAYIIYMIIPVFLWEHVPQQLLVSDPMIVTYVARFESLIILGIWGATLSSAIGGLLGAPRTLQALAEDGIVPRFLGKEFGANKEPRIATCVTFAIALVAIYFGSINVIAPLLTMIGLICYTMLNLATGLEDLMGNPSWRPVFRLPWPVSIAGAVLCLIAMLMIDSGAAMISICLTVIIYLALKRKRLTSSWEDIRYGILMFISRLTVYRLAALTPSSRSWRPNFLVFTGKPSQFSDHTLSFSTAITQSKGFLTVATFLNEEKESLNQIKSDIRSLLKKHQIEALLKIHPAKNVTTGMKQMIYNYGIGSLIPNTVVFGGISKEETILNYADVIKTAYSMGRNVVVINEDHRGTTEENPAYKLGGEIQIWWDHDSRRNSELMVVLAYMLQKDPVWKKSSLHLMDIVATEMERAERVQEYEEFIKRNRLKAKVSVYVSDKVKDEFLNLVKFFSQEAGMLFLGMRPPASQESLDDYATYFQSLPHKSVDFPPVALVLSSKQTNLQEVLQVEINSPT